MTARFCVSASPVSMARRQRGVVLVIALILLAVIGLSSAAALRGSLFGDKVSNNLRTGTVAMQAAEQALKVCENSVRVQVWTEALPALAPPVPIQAIAQNPAQWTVRANWALNPPGLATQLPAAAMTSPNSTVVYRRLPQCMVEEVELRRARGASPLTRVFLVTARGFSPDFQADGNGVPTAGSEVWLQSQIRR